MRDIFSILAPWWDTYLRIDTWLYFPKLLGQYFKKNISIYIYIYIYIDLYKHSDIKIILNLTVMKMYHQHKSSN